MHRLARFSLANRALIALVTVFVIAFGVMSAGALKRELIPSLQIPIAAVVTTDPGASPAVVDEQISKPVSDAVKGVDGLQTVTSTASTGTSVVTVQLDYGTDADKASNQLQTAVNRLANVLPEGANSQVIIGSFDDFPVIQLAVSANLSKQELKNRLDASAVDTLSRLDGVRDVQLSGAPTEQVVIRLEEQKMAAAGVTSTDVTNALTANGVRQSGGAVADNGDTRSIEVGEPYASVSDVRNVPVIPTAAAGAGAGRANAAPAAPEPVRLGDIATVDQQIAPLTGYSRVNGKPALTLAVTKTPDGNTVKVSNEVRDQLGALEQQIGGGTEFTVVFDQAPFIQQSISDLTTEGVLGLVMAVIVILAFLLSVRSTLVTAVSIPMSLLVTMIVLRLLGYSLNILTLAALTIAIGRVVDDSIVVIENIKRHLGEDTGTAADAPDAGNGVRPKSLKLRTIFAAVREVAGAVTASTITTVAVFAPLGLVGGQVGELFRPFAVTVGVALLASLFVALTIVPVLAYWWLGRGRTRTHRHVRADQDTPGDSPVTTLQRGYLPVLRRAIAHPVITIVIAVLVLGGTVALTPQLSTNFLGDSGQNTVTVSQKLPAGTSLARTNAAAQQVEKVIASVPGVQTVQTTVGSSGDATAAFLGNSGSNEATFSVTLSTDVDVVAAQAQMTDKLTALSGVGATTVAGGQAAFGASTIDVTVQAADETTLRKATSIVRKVVAATPGTSETTDNLSGDQPVVHVRVDRAKAAAAGTTEAQIGQQVSAQVSPRTIATVTSGASTQNVVLSLRAAPSDLPALRNLSIATPRGTKTLSQLAKVERVEVPTTVSRRDGERNATVSTTPAGKDLGSLTAALQSRIDALTLPSGATTEIGGVSQDQSQAFRQLFLALLAAIAIVYVVMVATFKSLVQPLLLMVSVPFASTGALVGLLVTGTPLGVPSLIGMLMLVGIVVTNAIVLIDLVNQRRVAGMSVRDSVLDGARLRLRPILMTAVATIFALIPMSLGLTGGGAFISQPLAVVVIGGLVSSTLLTLVLVPVLYSLVERARDRLHRFGQRRDLRRSKDGRPDGSDGKIEPLAEVNA